MTDQSESTHPLAPIFVKAWDDYASACQSLFQRLSDPSAAGSAPMPMAFFAPWREFAQTLGMDLNPQSGQQFKAQSLFAGAFPALGISREYQQIAQRLFDLTGRFQRCYAEFQQQGADMAQIAVKSMHRPNGKESPVANSPAAVYEAWIESAEAAYGQIAHGEAFARRLADLCNILSEFKIERGKLLERIARHLDLPSRAEVDSLHRQIRALTAVAHKPVPAKRKGAKSRRRRAT